MRALEGATESEKYSGTDATRVIQNAVDDLRTGTIYVKQGTYEIGPSEDGWLGGIRLHSNIRFVGEGPGATILKLRDSVNGERGQIRVSPLVVGEETSNVTIENLEIDGNESGNRDVPPYPYSPHHHGIVIHGDGSKVPEDRKPSNILVRNVNVHDTVRSNIVLAGRNCELENLWLSNSATDHWLYMAGATNCNLRGIHASGFARNEGIVLGVGKRRCSGNTISGLTISHIAQTPYQNDEPEGLEGRYPSKAVHFRRSSGNAFGNTIKDVEISLPEAEFGQSIQTFQPDTCIQNLNYRGPMGYGGILDVAPEAANVKLESASIHISPTSNRRPVTVVQSQGSAFLLKDVSIDDVGQGDEPAIRLVADETSIDQTTIRDVSAAANGPCLRAHGGNAGINKLFVENLQDLSDTGARITGNVNFIKKGIY
ncbi:hypothetical protein GCM10009000_035080 [Halobacterium noricense]